jgi:putative oxidoreductase
MRINALDLQTASIGLLVARVVIGLLMAAHGAQKLFGWFGGSGLSVTSEFFVALGFRPGRAFAAAASVSEFVSGLLVALGFLGPVGPAVMISVMIVAAVTVHWEHGLFASTNGIELPLLYAAVAFDFALAGFGSYSLDASFGIAGRWTTTATALVLAMGIIGALGSLAWRMRALSNTAEVASADRR